MRMFRLLAPALLLSLTPLAVSAQTSVPPNQMTQFKDTSILKPPPGVKVAVISFEDMECPACAHAFPIVHAAATHYHIPVEEYDFQIPFHKWSHTAAIFAHYLQARVLPELAEEYRREVFASQYRIASPDDLRNFTQQFMSQRGKQMPFVVDPTGQFDREVNQSTDLGMKLGVQHTPTIIVVTPNHWIEVADVSQMYAAIDQAEADAAHSAPAHTASAGSAHHATAHK